MTKFGVWIRADPRITLGALSENSGNSRKLHVTYQIKALGLLVHVDTIKFWSSGKFRKNSGKFWEKQYFCRPKGDHPASLLWGP